MYIALFYKKRAPPLELWCDDVIKGRKDVNFCIYRRNARVFHQAVMRILGVKTWILDQLAGGGAFLNVFIIQENIKSRASFSSWVGNDKIQISKPIIFARSLRGLITEKKLS